ncbi:MAG TPA: MerR family transcriptional regulator [Solirubrobacteraceae bacterium]|nr:MerR family transcriptional regulator [Solirubrobacteraceae bacterium]
MSPSPAPRTELRIGDLASLVGTTPRTIRYYEELGLLPAATEREAGQHRLYTEDHVERLRELLRLKALLGVSLDELRELVEAEDARAALREEFARAEDPSRRREILNEALGHLDRQLALVRRRQAELAALEDELSARRRRVRQRLSRSSEADVPARA